MGETVATTFNLPSCEAFPVGAQPAINTARINMSFTISRFFIVSLIDLFFGTSGRPQRRSYDYQYANIRLSIPICGKDFPARHVRSRFHHHRFGKQYDDGRHLQSGTVNVHCRFEKDAQNHFPRGIRACDTPWVRSDQANLVLPADTLPAEKDASLYGATRAGSPNAARSS